MDATKIQNLLMIAPPGSGKTRMINAIPHSIHVIDEEILRLTNLEKEFTLSLPRNSHQQEEIFRSILQCQTEIQILHDVKCYVKKNVFFLPITFNSETSFSALDTNPNWSVVRRMLFKYYAKDIGFAEFCILLMPVVGNISPIQAIEAVVYDQTKDGDDDPVKRKNNGCRILLSVDEMGCIVNNTFHDQVFDLLRNLFLCEYPLSLS